MAIAVTTATSGSFSGGFHSATIIPLMDEKDIEIREWIADIEEAVNIPHETFVRRLEVVVDTMRRQCRRKPR